MDFETAWNTVNEALDKGLMAAHGAGLLTRHDVGKVNAAQEVIANHINAQAQANQQLADHLNAQAKKKPCECEEPGTESDASASVPTPEVAAMEAEIAKAEAAAAKTMGE